MNFWNNGLYRQDDSLLKVDYIPDFLGVHLVFYESPKEKKSNGVMSRLAQRFTPLFQPTYHQTCDYNFMRLLFVQFKWEAMSGKAN